MWPNDLSGPYENAHLKPSVIKMIECWIQTLDPFLFRELYRMIWI